MKIKLLVLLLAIGVLAVATWRGLPNPSDPVEPVPDAGPAPCPLASTPAAVPADGRDAVHKALDYLAAHQCADGHWEGDHGTRPVALTSLVALALFMDGSDASEGSHAPHLRKATDWLIANAHRRDGLIFADHPSEASCYMYGHGLATLFLAGLYRSEADHERCKVLKDRIAAAVNYIVRAQSSQGGWYRTSKAEGHDLAEVLATVVQIQALQAAEIARFQVSLAAINDGQTYLEASLQKPGDGPLDCAAALAGRFRHEALVAKDPVVRDWLLQCRERLSLEREIRFGRDELAHFYYAQAVYKLGGNWNNLSDTALPGESLTWASHRQALRDQLERMQDGDGSWPAADGICAGRVYATALWCTVLRLGSRRYPANEKILMKP